MSPARPALLLVGHGSARVAGAGAPLEALAARLRAAGDGGAVAVRYLRQEPLLAPDDPLLDPTARVVPVLLGGGGLAAELAARAGPARVTPPVGDHPGFAALVERLALTAARAAGLDPAAAALLLIAHGGRHPGADAPARTLAGRLAAAGSFAAVTPLFLEQEPRAAGWRDHTAGRPAVALPLLLASGGHARHDGPQLFAGTEVPLAPPPTDPVALAAIVRDLAGES